MEYWAFLREASHLCEQIPGLTFADLARMPDEIVRLLTIINNVYLDFIHERQREAIESEKLAAAIQRYKAGR